jgi:hypothetical protein
MTYIIGAPKAEIFREAHRERVRREMEPRTFYSHLSEANCVAIDVLSTIRNTAAAGTLASGKSAAAAKVLSGVSGLAIAGGALGVAAGLNIMKSAGVKFANSLKNEDWEGVCDNFTFGLVGAAYGTVSGSMVVSNAAALAGAAATAAAASMSITAAGFAMYGLLGIWSGYGLAINHTFRSQLKDRLKGGQDLHATLSWLGSLVRGTWSKGALEKKWDQFASRTSEAACRLVREKVTGEFLKRLEAGDPEAIAEAKFIVKEVERENAKQLVKNYLLMTIALFGIAAFICGILLAASPAAPLLFALGAVLWLGFDSSKAHEKLGDLFFGKSEIPAPNIAPLVRSERWTKRSPISSTTSALKEDSLPIPLKPMGATSRRLQRISGTQIGNPPNLALSSNF